MTLEGLIALTLRRRVTIAMLAAATVLVGVTSYLSLPVELLPPGFASDEVSVWVPVATSNPVEVQEQVIRPAEQEIRTIAGVERLWSSARPDQARLRVSFARGVDLDLAVAELRDRLERARVQWPEDVREYYIWRFNADTDIPIFSFAIDLERYSDEVTFYVEEKVIKPLETLPGVAKVDCWGLLDDQIRIFVDRDRALASGVGIYQLTQDLRDSNVEISGGEVEEFGTRYALRTDGRFGSVEEIRSWPVNERGLRLRQLARVEPVKAIREFMALSRNRRILWIRVFKESSANTVATADRVRATVSAQLAPDPRLAEMGGRVRLYPRADIGRIVTEALNTLRNTAATGGVLALLILFFFLRRFRLTLIITLAIPLSLLITLGIIWFGGGTLNVLAMLGITVAIGMLIDNSIVVVENISRLRDEGATPWDAARRGAAEVALAITLSTMTTLAAFLPLIFMSGSEQVSYFTGGIGLPLCTAVLSSLFVAMLFIPLAALTFYGRRSSIGSGRSWRRPASVERGRALYARALGWSLSRRFHVVVLVGTAVAVGTAMAWQSLPKVDLQSDSGGAIGIEVELDRNFTLDDAYGVMTTLGRYVDQHAERYDVEHFWCFFRREGGDLRVELAHRDMARTRETARRLREDLPEIPGVRLHLGIEEQSGDQNKLTVQIFGPDTATLLHLSREARDLLEGTPGVLSTSCDLEEGKEEIHVVPDRERAVRYGIDPRVLRGTVEYGLRGFYFSDLVVGEREIPLIIEFEGSEERDLAELRDLPIMGLSGQEVPLSTVADVKVRRGFGEIQRENGQAQASIILEVDDKDRSAVAAAVRDRLAGFPLPPGYSFIEKRSAETAESMAELLAALGLALVFVFLLMGILFESFVLPISVLASVPFAGAGLVWALAATRTPLDLIGQIGILVLVGVVVNNGIVLIDCAHRIRAAGAPRTRALVEAGRTRFRPILMTAATTIAGLLPMALSDGGGSEISYKALARGVIGGLCVSTFFTLFFVPILYSLCDDLRLLSGRALRSLATTPSRRRLARPARVP